MADDPDNNLERLNGVVNEIEAHYQRLLREAKLGRATPASIMQELCETTMPLLKDFAVRSFAEVLAVRQYIHEHVEPAIMQMGDQMDSVLFLEDAEMITQRLLSYRSMLEGGIARLTGDDKTKMETELAEVDRTLARVAEITDDEDDPDPDADDPADDPEEVEEESGRAVGTA